MNFRWELKKKLKKNVRCSSFTIARIINSAIIWASTRETLNSGVCEQHRRRTACASAQSDQRLFIRFLESIICKLAAGEISIFKLVSSLYSWGDWFEALFVETPRRQVFSQRGQYDTKQSSVFRKKYPWKKITHQAFLHFADMEEGIFFHTTQFTHISLTSLLWGIGKQCRTRSDPAERDIWSGSPPFAYRMFYKNLRKW